MGAGSPKKRTVNICGNCGSEFKAGGLMCSTCAAKLKLVRELLAIGRKIRRAAEERERKAKGFSWKEE